MADLNKDEQQNVRAAMRFLRSRFGTWRSVAKALGFSTRSITGTVYGEGASARLAFRVARLAGVPMEDVLSGRYPTPGACPKCGHVQAT